ncbi:MAG TPA: AzlC family ABC transporter permease [Burkholderiales bacterium]|nr:AzlC family ABC transporter permease [Burkholderiales bacterium]
MQREKISNLGEGALASIPLLVGIVPWGIVAGVAMTSAGLSRAQAVAMSVFVFAGSAQLAVLPLLIAKAPLWVMYATALVVNLRYVIYSAVLAPHFEHLSRPWRALLSYITVDGIFALFAGKFRPGRGEPNKHWHFLGGSLVMWTGWQVSSWVGIFAGALIPHSWSLEFASTLALIAILMPLLFDRAAVCGALAAGAVGLVAAKWPMNTGLLAAIAAGVAVALAVARLGARPRERG